MAYNFVDWKAGDIERITEEEIEKAIIRVSLDRAPAFDYISSTIVLNLIRMRNIKIREEQRII